MSTASTGWVDRAEDASTLRITDILAYLRGNLLLAVGLPVACLLLGVAAVVVMKPVYRSEVVLLPISDDGVSGQLAGLGGQLGGLASLAGISMPGNDSSVAAVATLGSRQLLASFIEREGLLPVLFEDDFDRKTGKWMTDDPPTLEDAVDLFERKIRTVVDDEDTGIVTVSIDWRDPAIAAQWAAQLVTLADDEMRRRSIDEARASMAFLEKHLQETGVVELRQAIYSLMESETKRIMLASSRPEYAFRVIDPARTPDADAPVWPNVPLILIAALLSGVGIVFLVAVVKAPAARRVLE